MYSLETIAHAQIDNSRLLDVISIKSAAWDYPLQSQLQWINDNIFPSDIHCILKAGTTDVAYLNLIDIELQIDGFPQKAYGVGNVCSLERGKGYGRALMELSDCYIRAQARVGLLFCKEALLDFYARFGWFRIPYSRLEMSVSFENIHVMLYNYSKDFTHLKYGGYSF